MASLDCLPPEILQEVLSYLPIPSLLSYGQTSKSNHALQFIALRSLHLGVFHTKISSLVSSMTSPRLSVPPPVCIILPRKDTTFKPDVIHAQNQLVRTVISRYRTPLRELDLAIWELEESTAEALAGMQNLRRLSLRLDHPHIRHRDVTRRDWDVATPSTLWNHFKDCFGRLESLVLERSGITDYQLGQIIRHNPRMRELKLHKCFGLGVEFFEELTRTPVAESLKVFCFTKSDGREIDDRVLEYIGMMPNLTTLSFYGCENIDGKKARKLNAEQWHIPDLTLPRSPDSPPSGLIEVDPEYK
ncbi:MAG: hypothetical protein M1819_004869 [Sarea resinae]|nr:MAG: hypothetical protein M1819_004869 [Sarea resinae]